MAKNPANKPHKAEKKKKKETIWLEVCPNCGRQLSGQEFLPSVGKLQMQVGMMIDPVAGRFLCPQCNFSGAPIQVREEEYSKIPFEKREVDIPLPQKDPEYWNMFFIYLLGAILLLLLSVLIEDAFTRAMLGAIYLALGLYIALRSPKRHKDVKIPEKKK